MFLKHSFERKPNKCVLRYRLPYTLCRMHELIKLSKLLRRHLTHISLEQKHPRSGIKKTHAFSNTVASSFFPEKVPPASSRGIWSKYTFHCDRKPMTCAGFETSLWRRNSTTGFISGYTVTGEGGFLYLLSRSRRPETAFQGEDGGVRARVCGIACGASGIRQCRQHVMKIGETYGSGGRRVALACRRLSGFVVTDSASRRREVRI